MCLQVTGLMQVRGVSLLSLSPSILSFSWVPSIGELNLSNQIWCLNRKRVETV